MLPCILALSLCWLSRVLLWCSDVRVTNQYKDSRNRKIMFTACCSHMPFIVIMLTVHNVTYWVRRNPWHRFLVGKPERNRPFGRPKGRWEDTIKVNLKEVEWESMDLIDMSQYRDKWWALVNKEINLRLHNMQGICWLAEDLLASWEGLYAMELVGWPANLSVCLWSARCCVVCALGVAYLDILKLQRK